MLSENNYSEIYRKVHKALQPSILKQYEKAQSLNIKKYIELDHKANDETFNNMIKT